MIHYRAVEIIDQVYLEIKNYGHEEQKKKLIAGIVITGGGAQLKHLKQLVEYVTGMDTRIGYPNEYLAGETDKEIASPLYATAVGLVMDGLERKALDKAEQQELENLENSERLNPSEGTTQEEVANENTENDKDTEQTQAVPQQPNQPARPSRNVVEKWFDKLKDFLDNAE